MSDEAEPLKIEDVEKIVELSKKVSEQELSIKSLSDKCTDYETTISKQKSDIERLQKIIADNFVASKEKPVSDIQPTKTFGDIYKEMIANNTPKQS